MIPDDGSTDSNPRFTSLPIPPLGDVPVYKSNPASTLHTPENSGRFLLSTGRFLVYYKKNYGEKQILNKLKKASINIAHRGNELSLAQELEEGDGVLFPRIGVAVLNSYPTKEQISILAQGHEPNDLIVEPERVIYAADALSTEYLKGYYDAVKHLYEESLQDRDSSVTSSVSPIDTTWGLQSTHVVNSPYTGKGVKIAVLDTGFYTGHVDFINREIDIFSSIKNESVDDFNGHGTHCIGTALGPKVSTLGVRYGIAYDSNIYAGKVLSNAGRGSDSDILDGIEWALECGCQIVSMSLGAAADPTKPDDYSVIFEEVAKNALSQGTLIIAAAGNSSQRKLGFINPVSHPANCPSILAVGAVDQNLNVCDFSNRGQIDIAAPGLDVYSSWISPSLTETISGTSMATPHVAGIAALWLEANPNASPNELWQLLTRNARRLNGASSDLGAGLVQAPL